MYYVQLDCGHEFEVANLLNAPKVGKYDVCPVCHTVEKVTGIIEGVIAESEANDNGRGEDTRDGGS